MTIYFPKASPIDINMTDAIKWEPVARTIADFTAVPSYFTVMLRHYVIRNKVQNIEHV